MYLSQVFKIELLREGKETIQSANTIILKEPNEVEILKSVDRAYLACVAN